MRKAILAAMAAKMRKIILATLAAGVLAVGSLFANPTMAHARPHYYCHDNPAASQQTHDRCDQICDQWEAEGKPHPCDKVATTTTTQAPTVAPVQAPSVSPTEPVQPAGKPAVVSPPKALAAPQQAIDAAKAAPATRVDPANPSAPATHVDVNQQVQSVVNAHSSNVNVVTAGGQTLVQPPHWTYVDYDVYHRPALYNPLTEAMTFRYFYGGAYRDVYVAAGSRVVLDAATVGVFPFTAVGESYVTSGSFYGGAWVPPEGWTGPPPSDYTPPAPPAVYHDVSAYVPADNQTVQVGQVTAVGHDDSLPAGSQDMFMLDDSTLAWGQATNPSDGGQITVNKTQSVPGVGPIDNGSFLVALAAHQQPTHSWRPWVLGGGVLVIVAGLIGWLVIRRKRVSV